MATGLRYSWRERLKSLILAGACGLGVGFLLALGQRRPADRWISILYGLLAGLTISILARTLSWWLRDRLHRLSNTRRTLAYGALLFVSGLGAWVLTGLLINALTGAGIRLFSLDSLLSIALTGALAIVLGFAFASFERMKTRLAESVARLKEAEFAERELQLARELQSRLLPPPEIEGEGYRVAARNLAARVVAGDFYDVFRLAGGALGLAVADVAGKGMAASLIMASAKARLPLLAADRPAGEVLRELNRVLAAELSSREFVALAFARFDPERGTLSLANAGLPDPHLLRQGEPPLALSVPGPRLPLGVRPEVAYEALEVTLAPGDRLLLFTDGLAEAPAAAGEPLGYPALAALMAEGDSLPPLAWLDALLERVRTATSPALEDDWTVLLLERAIRD
ncbi:MAG TPA: PP2C family protein-serine/threonine phosphatase [Thermoanaerobaculia bacterium]|nr:PP2C family protein-serine/threonine phosphatase [Thermoanaerobaculia bacterium]